MFMRNVMFCMMLVIGFAIGGCIPTGGTGATTIGNGRVDPIEAATLRMAVGLAMNQKPEAIKPAYFVSSALLSMTKDNTAILNDVDSVIAVELNKLDLDAMTKASVMELAGLIKEYVITILNGEGIKVDQRYVVAIDLIKIVNEVAKSRMDMLPDQK